MSDLRFYWDPVCPFAWLTSRWVHQVKAQRSLEVDWRFISLRLLNAHIDYDAHFPPEYEEGHDAGLRLLRMAAAIRDEAGPGAMEDLYTHLSSSIFDESDTEYRTKIGKPEHVLPILTELGHADSFADALFDTSWDEVIQSETDEALALTGKDVGTPIIHFDPPDGPGLFGPVISRLPAAGDAVQLWDHVTGLARFPSFAELKRSLRERPQLRALGVEPDQAGLIEDWHAGSRRQKK